MPEQVTGKRDHDVDDRDRDKENRGDHDRDRKPPEPPGRIIHPQRSHGEQCRRD